METITVQRQRERIEELARLIAERAQLEISIRASYEAREATTRSHFAAERERWTSQLQREHSAIQSQLNHALAEVARDYERAVEQAATEHDGGYRDTVQQAERAVAEAEEDHEATRDRSKQATDEAVRETARKLHEFKERLHERRSEGSNLEAQVSKILRRRRCLREARQLSEPAGVCQAADPLADYARHMESAARLLQGFGEHASAKFLASGWLFVIFVFTWITLLVATVAFDLVDLNRLAWPLAVASGAIALGTAWIVYVAVRPSVVRQTMEQYTAFRESLANAAKALHVAETLAAAEADTRRIALQQQSDRELQQIESDYRRRREAIASQRESRLKAASERLQSQRQKFSETRQMRQEETNRQAHSRLQQLQETCDGQLQRLQERHDRELAAGRESFQRSWERLVQKWRAGLEQFQSAVDAMNQFCAERFPAWERIAESHWLPPDTELPAVRFGEYLLRLDMFEGGVSAITELKPVRDTFSLPAVSSFANRPSLLWEAWGEGRSLASRAIQNVMLRLLTSLPPAKVRFTILDPVGLGQNFSAFMHLADFDEELVTHRIWTETAHINQRLADLTEHMENVIQTYLRNEFNSIDEYNRQAGEVAEPFQVLVVANFPSGFSDEAAQRLLSIVASGARCGVYTLISTDAKLDWPRNFDLADLEAHSATLQWNGQRFCWLEEDLKDLPLALDAPPDDERLTEIIRAAGQRAKEATRVEVPFATVTAQRKDWWTGDSRDGLEVALGRAGASKLQYLRLGQGTSQHVLISGKTGSGKSTLLHVLITNAALYYPPGDVEFYLIDFKKGVEFKPYASLRLPHARVVAIESEREFGMSVLERLDWELRRRGDLFRESAVQDIKSFRDLHPEQALPRLLLVIDEFQEFFVQDDKLAQDASLLLDRLVRQGRAFGIHVLLGSQTLAGAYSLARSTIGQMAVRIALQCSEADSHLILSEDNTAARLLRRPGEAIYNDANGLFEGNHPFQIVWLSAGEQESYLRQLRDLATDRQVVLPPPIIFEGNVAADPSENDLLRQHLAGQYPASAQRGLLAWLGAAVSIKEPTATAFHRQSGANLLLVGQQEETAMGVLANCIVSLGATAMKNRTADAAPRFLVLDGTRPEAPQAGFWRRLARQVPLDIQVLSPQEAASLIRTTAEELVSRQEHDEEAGRPTFLIVFNLPRFRELRRGDDDFGFSGFREDQTPAVGKQFATIVRDGPLAGVHTLMWCDTFSNLNRWFDRQTLRDINYRVLFQMSATDSSNLMDSPEASRLGVHRAILYSEEQGRFEKFRPYGLPSPEWLDWVRQQWEHGGPGRPPD